VRVNYWESIYNVVINVASGWFGVALIRDIFATGGSHGLASVLYNMFMGCVYFNIAVTIKEVKKLNA